MSKAHVYRQKTAVMQYAEGLLEVAENNISILQITPEIEEKIVLCLALYCQSPYSGIQSFFEHICNEKISIGKISNILAKASKKAKEFDDTINLKNINNMAIDEIFQSGKPILTGVDPESTFIFTMEPMNDRSGESWNLILDDAKDKGLNPKVSIGDGAKGLIAGVERTFPETEIQADTFHALYDLGKEVSKLERRAIKLINVDIELERKLNGAKPRKPEKLKESRENNLQKMNEAIKIYDQLKILFLWLKMLLGFSGYGFVDSQILVKWVLSEMEVAAKGNAGLLAEIKKIRNLVPNLLSFTKRLEQEFDRIAITFGVPPDSCHQIYRQDSYLSYCSQGIEERCHIVNLLQDKYINVQNAIELAKDSTKKASSIVENVNGRIRVYIEVKRIIPDAFFILLKVYFNTKRYKRSRYENRVGKSPYELLTQTSQPEFFEAIGF